MSKLRLLIAAVLLSGCALWVASQGFPAAPADLSTTPSGSMWRALVHLSTNAFVPWREDPLLVLLARLLSAAPEQVNLAEPTSYFWVSGAVYLASMLACGLTLGLTPLLSLLVAVASALIILLLLGAEQGATAALAWWPALSACVLASVAPRATTHAAQQGPLMVLALFFAYRLGVAGGALSIPLASLALCMPAMLGYKLRTIGIWSLVVLGPPLVMTAAIPPVPFPDYPPQARVIADDGLPGIVRPLTGPDLPIAVIDRTAIRDALVPTSLALLLLTLVAGWGLRRSQRYLWLVALSGALAVFLDSAPPESVALMMPMESIRRLLPGLYLYFLPPLVIAISSILLVVLLALRNQWLPIAGLVLATTAVWHMSSIDRPPRHGILERPRIDVVSGIFALPLCRDSAAASQHCRNILASPSLSVLGNYGAAILRSHYAQVERVSRGPGRVVAASTNQGSIALAHDKDPATRWSAKRGEEHSWLLIRKPQAQPAIGIALETGQYASDFPGGLEVYVGDSALQCEPSEVQRQRWNLIFKSDDWQGPVKLSPEGYPFYLGQPDVEIPFTQPIKGSCFLVRQTKRRAIFDWSVAEVRFLFERKQRSPTLDDGHRQSIALRPNPLKEG
ncbi:MAG: hypothetical protein QY326_01280 [Bdellovibrionota bacterium]|nr:MAG: hypothetical protein QY326_01280 [Bdellovibrionota bacterium]